MQAFKAAFATDGTDWDKLPYDMYKHGAGGMLFGTLCGVPNGCGGLCNLLGLGYALAPSICGHYSTTEFPTSQLPDLYYADTGYGPSNYTYTKQPMADDDVLAHTTALSTLCHVSISKFCFAAGINLSTPGLYSYSQKADRCGKIVADMAAYTAGLINDYALGNGNTDPYSLPPDVQFCADCHTSSSDPAIIPAQNGKLHCNECHVDNSIHSGLRLIIDGVWTADGTGTPKNTFTSGDAIQYHVRFHVLGAGACYVRAVKSKVKDGAGVKMLALKRNETLNAATYDWMWSDTIGAGDATGTARVIMRLKMFDYQGGNLLGSEILKHKFTIV